MQRRHALLAEADAGDGAGDGAPGGGSPKGGQGNQPGDGESVPKTQFIAALNNANRKYEALEAEMAELRAQVKAKPAEAPKRYTRSQLQAAVTAGEITQEQADAQIELQVNSDAEARAERVALATVSTEKRAELVSSHIARYKAVAPEILDDTHETRQKIKEEFNTLVRLAPDPKVAAQDPATQLNAIRAVLGPIDKLERARSGRFQADHHQETGGGSGGGERPNPKTGKLADQLNAAAKEHYADGIKKGRYKDWAAVEDELKFASAGVKRRLGIA